jgi:hypothetical protein
MNDNVTTPGVTHDGLPVQGYRPQSAERVARVNAMKTAEENVLRMLDALLDDPDTDKRWLHIARTNIEQGFMAANRSIFKPSRLTLPGDTVAATLFDKTIPPHETSARATSWDRRPGEEGWFCAHTGREVNLQGFYLNKPAQR